ncbi:hypothetical protein D6D05_09539 [Aureobasidium pullulans]|uniref:MARVEL domain-containing protein n=3 Tax=Aureobasidium pullulans TaxID=5580 RepID=A0A074X4F5_AURPU|nr:uncharacterized protein M438DRAFT_326326 [Aureobasidium pullulans EXF-150]KEQ80400.1 hypothetical protein M438DRAFT_326326 [Aureobasidium pullulans EXF-150]THW81730.1 hypothetical protein D6D15_10542 [Aureobasidium pullulans]THX68135.1 hypothetical protein D6D05_09539 [Aureobasidium pullulans]THY12964.1 hypothetical protein D6D00_10316 [Aureobasidium pullulans]
MPIPSYGALPLSETFLCVRGLSLIAMIGIVGLTANFVAVINGSGIEPPKEIVGTLSITCIATLYTLISIPFYMAQANLGLFIMTAIDSLLLLAFIVVSVTLGKPLSLLNCFAIAEVDGKIDATGVAYWLQSLVQNIKQGGSIGLYVWAGTTRINCLETKAIWGLCIALCILFSCSCILLPTLWFKSKRAGLLPKKIEAA